MKGLFIPLLGLLLAVSAVQAAPANSAAPAAAIQGTEVVKVSAEQARELDVGPVGTRSFDRRREAVGIIDFNQDATLPVFAPYQGRIGRVLVRAGEDVRAGQVLYTVQVPDFAQASAALISTAGQLRLADEVLSRARALREAGSISTRELEQNTADQQSADANFRAARRTLALFGLADADIDAVAASRQVDTEMPVRSPIAGRVTARQAVQGQLVQPGAMPAPVTVADLRTLWMVASVPESEAADYRVGQSVSVSVQAWPGRAFPGRIVYMADAVDPVTHRLALRAELTVPRGEVKPQMLATFMISVGAPVKSPAVRETALARENDGSFSAWVTRDGLEFRRRPVVIGMTQAGHVQIIDGLKAGDTIARDKTLFLSNLYKISVR
jgi:cobalt-zinc-cadmium efflux system membrane fusion protein